MGKGSEQGNSQKEEERRKSKSAGQDGKDSLSDSSSPREDLMVAEQDDEVLT